MVRRLLPLFVVMTSLLPALALADIEPPPSGPATVLDFLGGAKYLSMLGAVVLGLVLLFSRRINVWIRAAVMLACLLVFGVDLVYSLHPSPMCATTKLYMFKYTTGRFFPVFIAYALVIFVPSLFGRKLFCGWVCPLGAFQELVGKIPLPLKFKQPSFTAMNAIRLSLIVMFFITFHAGRAHIKALAETLGADTTEQAWRVYSAINIYDPINMFELLHLRVSPMWFVMTAVLVAFSLVLYRPFCYTVCPIGGLTWLLERVAPGRIRVDHAKCNSCGKCVKKAPCPTMQPLLEGKTANLPDCTSCGECLNTCPTDAISFGFRGK
jgi:polyferredoxin